jgi:hypothetical protein
MGMLISDDLKRHGSQLAENINPYNPIVQQQLHELAGGVGAQTFQRELVGETLLDLKVKTQALVLSFEGGFRWVALVMAAGLLLILVVRKPKPDAQIEMRVGESGAVASHRSGC